MFDDSKGKKLFIIEAKMINDTYPGLNYIVKNDIHYIRGTLELFNDKKIWVDSYQIEIFWVPEYPYRFPFVFEVGKRIPNNQDWHCFENDGHCCIKAQPEELMLCRKGINIKWFIDAQLVPYFFNQSFREENGYYFIERPHGIMGTIESLSSILKTNSINAIINLLFLFKNKIEYKPTAKCVCGSKKKYKKCHRRAMRYLTLMKEYNIDELIKNIQKYQKIISIFFPLPLLFSIV